MENTSKRFFLGKYPLVYRVEMLVPRDVAALGGLEGRLLACIDISAKKGVFCWGEGVVVEFSTEKTYVQEWGKSFRGHVRLEAQNLHARFTGVRVPESELASLALP